MRLLRQIAAALALRTAGATLSHAALGAIFLIGWHEPARLGASAAEDLTAVLLFEFLFLHSTGLLLGARSVGNRILPALLVMFYAGVAVAVGLSLESHALLGFFAWHLASSLWSDLDMEEVPGVSLARYLSVLLLFIAAAAAGGLVPWPELGWSAVPSTSVPRTGSGEFRRALVPAFGTLYFSGRAVLEMALRYWERHGMRDDWKVDGEAASGVGGDP